MDEITAEFTTEEVQKKADALEEKSEAEEPSLKAKKKGSSWIPFWVGLLTIIGMLVIAFTVWVR
ncbi:MAG: hypothetical protein JKY15_07745 [Deltaproteobacteria bacterium]|nr:hypothetical protein [Deltaproteobacteria bacterium]